MDYFTACYTWMCAYKTAPVVSSVSVMEYKYRIWNSVFLLLLMEAQVLRRLFESVYIFKYSPSARMHIVTYLSSFFSSTIPLLYATELVCVDWCSCVLLGLDSSAPLPCYSWTISERKMTMRSLMVTGLNMFCLHVILQKSLFMVDL